MTGAYNSFFRMFDRETGRGVTLEAWRENSKPRAVLRTRRVYTGGKRRRGDVGVDSLDFTKKILHMAWHPSENIIAIAATNNLYIFQDRVNPETQAQWQRYGQTQSFYWLSQIMTHIYLDVSEMAQGVGQSMWDNYVKAKLFHDTLRCNIWLFWQKIWFKIKWQETVNLFDRRGRWIIIFA